MADFYLIKNEKTGLYFDGRFFTFTGETAGDSQARFASEKNATEEIKKFRSCGNDVSDLVIVPANVTPLASIKPKLSEQRAGFVIRFEHPGKYGKTVYWKGNKKAPKLDYSTLHYGPQAPNTASVFATLAEVNDVYNSFKDVELPRLIKQSKADHRKAVQRYNESYDQKFHSKPVDTTTPMYESVIMDVVQVG